MANPILDWTVIVRQVSQAASAYFAQELVRTISATASPPPEPRLIEPKLRVELPSEPSGAAIPQGEGSEGCPTCAIHKAVLSARGHVESIVVYAERNGEIDRALPATLLLARQELAQAGELTRAYKASAPTMGAHCDATLEALSRAAVALPDPSECSAERCSDAMPALTDAMHAATELAVEHEALLKRARGGERLRAVAKEYGVTDPDAFLSALLKEMTSA